MDSRLSEIITRLNNQDTNSALHRSEMKERMEEIRDEFTIVRTKFEDVAKEKWYQRGFVAAISVAISALWAWLSRDPSS